MSLSIATNIASLTAYHDLSRMDGAMTTSLQRLSSGYRINRAADDASGLAISEGLRSQIRGMTQAARNTQDGISVVRTADGALGATTEILQRMRDLSLQAANAGALTGGETAGIQREIDQLRAEVSQIADTTTWNGTKLLDGTYRGTFQVGADVGQTLTVIIGGAGAGMDVAGLGLSAVDVTSAGGVTVPSTVTDAVSADQGTPASGKVTLAGDYVSAGTYPAAFAGLEGTISYDGKSFDLGSVDYTGAVTATDYIDKLNVAALPVLGTSHTPFTGSAGGLLFTGDTPGAGSTAADAVRLTPAYTGRSGTTAAITSIDAAIERISSIRADLGAVENSFEHTVDRLDVAIANTSASDGRVRDTDMAQEMVNFTRIQTLTEAGTAMLAHATGAPQTILKLLG
jgi:flagellin